LTVPLAVLN